MYNKVILLIFPNLLLLLNLHHFSFVSHFNLNLYKYLPNLFNFVVFLKVLITWCAASSFMPSYLSFETCSFRLLVSAHFSVICTLFPSLQTENLPFPAHFLRYLGLHIPSWKHANHFLFIQITSDCIQFPSPILALRRCM